jgi:hypothetical protein
MSAGASPTEGDRTTQAQDESVTKRKEQEAADKAAADAFAANRQREVYEIKGKIKAIDEENQAMADAGQTAQAMAFQRAQDQDRWQKEREAGGVKQGIVGRIMGRGDLDMQGAADREMRMALDDDFRKQEVNAEKQAARADNRRKRLADMAEKERKRIGIGRDALTGELVADQPGRRLSPRMRRILEAGNKAQAAEQNRQNLEALQRRAAEAAIKTQEQAILTAENTKKIRELQEKIMGP